MQNYTNGKLHLAVIILRTCCENGVVVRLLVDHMQQKKLLGFSAVIVKEANLYSAWCPDLDVASQGDTVESALANLKEALELHIECLSSAQFKEMKSRQLSRLITTIELPV